jgi:renalase
MLSYKNKSKLNINSIKFNEDRLAWAANENSKERFKSNEILWTLQCTEKYSKKIINLFKNNKNFYINKITKKFENLTGLSHKNLIFKSIHGWKYAYSLSNNNLGSFWSNKSNLGVCADWLDGPKAENAWLNSNSLFKKIKKKYY